MTLLWGDSSTGPYSKRVIRPVLHVHVAAKSKRISQLLCRYGTNHIPPQPRVGELLIALPYW